MAWKMKNYQIKLIEVFFTENNLIQMIVNKKKNMTNNQNMIKNILLRADNIKVIKKNLVNIQTHLKHPNHSNEVNNKNFIFLNRIMNIIRPLNQIFMKKQLFVTALQRSSIEFLI